MIKVVKFQQYIHKGLAVLSIFRALGSTWTPEHQLKVKIIHIDIGLFFLILFYIQNNITYYIMASIILDY